MVRAIAAATITIALIDGSVSGNLNGLTGRVRVDYESNTVYLGGYEYGGDRDVGGVMNGMN